MLENRAFYVKNLLPESKRQGTSPACKGGRRTHLPIFAVPLAVSDL
jgi:hypothetical protein